ncbi:MAG: hypothetical protein WDO14_19385 [Bacteroidota bacterium]
MKTPLQSIEIQSIYKNSRNVAVSLPSRMARCTPDTYRAIFAIDTELRKLKGQLILSDLFRSYEMQFQANADFVAKRKTAYSPPPGGSMHEAGRGMDIDLKSIKVPLKNFWKIAAKYGFYPIIDAPNAGVDEAWHFDHRGSHQVVYDYYASGKGTNFKPYKAMAASAITAIDVRVDTFGEHQKQAQLQFGLVRLGKNIGNVDGLIGRKTQDAIVALGLQFRPQDIDTMLIDVENLLQARFPEEYKKAFE